MNKLTKYLAAAPALLMSAVPSVTHAMGMYRDDFQGMMPPSDGIVVAGAGTGAELAIIVFILMLFFWVAVILLWIFWLFMIIDIVRRDWKSPGDRAAYLVLVIFLSVLGAIIYYFGVKRHLDRKNGNK